MKKLLLGFVFLSLSSCVDGDNDFFQLGEFRVLAVQADTPEIDGSSLTPITVTLTPFISDIDAGGRTIAIDILACPDPGLELGNDPVCDPDLATTQDISYASIDSTTLGSRLTGAMPAFTVDVPPGLLTGQTDQVKFNGLDYLVTMHFVAGTETIKTYRRITISEKTPKNMNPSIENVLLNGETAGSLQNLDELTIDIAAGFTPETYDYEDLDGIQVEKEEVYTVSWFTFKGTTNLRRTFLDETAVFEKSSGETDPFIVAILRDDRGGIDFELRE